MWAQPAGFYDEGLIVSGAQRILRGQHLYTDFTSGYPPGQFYTIALVFRLFGSSLVSERIWDSVWRLAIVAAAVWLGREFAGKNFKLIPLTCCAALVGATGFRLCPMVSATLPCLCALSCTLAFLRTRNPRWIFVAGLLIGCTALYRHDLAVCAGMAVLGSVLRSGRAVVWLAAGALLAVSPAVIYFAVTVPWQILADTFWKFPQLNVAARHLPLLASLLDFLQYLLLPAAILAYAAFEIRRTSGGRRATLIILTVTAALFMILATQRLDSVHAFPCLLICLVILAGCARANLPHRVLLALALLSYGVLPVLDWAGQLWVTGILPVSGIARAGMVRISADQARAVRYVHDHVPAGEQMFVGTATHSRVFVNDALFSFLVDRPQATRYDMWLPGSMNSGPVQSEIVRELETGAVHYAVLFDAPRSKELNLSSVDTGVRIVDDYLDRRYHPVAVFGRYRILQR